MIPVHWVEPSAIDASMIVKSNRSHTSGDSFPTGSTMVVYRFYDDSFNEAFCNFHVNITIGKTGSGPLHSAPCI